MDELPDVVDSRNARIRFLTSEEGGRRTAPATGLRSQLDLGSSQTSCIVEGDADGAAFPVGTDVDVRIRVIFPWVHDEFFALDGVRLYEGSKLVAIGRFRDKS